jgi:hypothetical protein
LFYWYNRTNADAARNLQDFDEVGGGGQNVGASNSNCNSDSKADGACGEASSLKGGHLDSKKGS